MNSAFPRATADFGSESLFDSNKCVPRSYPCYRRTNRLPRRHRHREQVDDEDGPPMNSVLDIVSGAHGGSFNSRPKPQVRKVSTLYLVHLQVLTTGQPNASMSTRNSGFAASSSTQTPPAQYQILYVIVFGFPQARASITIAHFQGLAAGGTTEPEALSDVENAFKIGYRQPWEAARAVRKNGETIGGEGGRWMIGVKWMVRCFITKHRVRLRC